ncbi:WASH complex subunit 3 [Galendromus occidentalis]|uniref:WASH complex subunit 3 n=1 Tax=Galendromus occidentalis TaxID=34638 RepID=A0AAJ6QU34_9ACAR|nr:WASH complex subunit 3 [Galendromus occidentalis]
MDEDGLPLSGVDLNKVPPIPQKHTVTFLNHYLSRSSQLLNGLSGAAERKLEKVLTQLQQIEAGVCILEAKLDSIPGMTDGITPEPDPEPVKQPPPVVTTQPTKSTSDQEPTPSSPAPSQAPAAVESAPLEEPGGAESQAIQPICKDPRFRMYFDMLKKGVPLPGVQQKMMLSGVDPELILNPNAPAPPPDPDDEE